MPRIRCIGSKRKTDQEIFFAGDRRRDVGCCCCCCSCSPGCLQQTKKAFSGVQGSLQGGARCGRLLRLQAGRFRMEFQG